MKNVRSLALALFVACLCSTVSGVVAAPRVLTAHGQLKTWTDTAFTVVSGKKTLTFTRNADTQVVPARSGRIGVGADVIVSYVEIPHTGYGTSKVTFTLAAQKVVANSHKP